MGCRCPLTNTTTLIGFDWNCGICGKLPPTSHRILRKLPGLAWSVSGRKAKGSACWRAEGAPKEFRESGSLFWKAFPIFWRTGLREKPFRFCASSTHRGNGRFSNCLICWRGREHYMNKNRLASLKEQMASLKQMDDKDIDFSDIPEISDFAGFERGKFQRPTEAGDIAARCRCVGLVQKSPFRLPIRHKRRTAPIYSRSALIDRAYIKPFKWFSGLVPGLDHPLGLRNRQAGCECRQQQVFVQGSPPIAGSHP